VFCSQSCAASYNNRGVRRHGNPPNDCKRCGNKTRDARSIYCSQECALVVVIKYETLEEKQEARKLSGRVAGAKYRARLNDNTSKVSDKEKELIKDFYRKCQRGYEVDHIIPVSKGGAHRIWNLQYLTISENRSKQARMPD
tara:strand:- start:118 stop:540 length:423 start_codon:yes stop_codon:yes gene_type:complete